MAYTLVSTKYIPAQTGLKYIKGNGREAPKGTIAIENGMYLVRGEIVPAKFIFDFWDGVSKDYNLDAYSIIKSAMGDKKLTEKRRNEIQEEVKKIAEKSGRSFNSCGNAFLSAYDLPSDDKCGFNN